VQRFWVWKKGPIDVMSGYHTLSAHLSTYETLLSIDPRSLSDLDSLL